MKTNYKIYCCIFLKYEFLNCMTGERLKGKRNKYVNKKKILKNHKMNTKQFNIKKLIIILVNILRNLTKPHESITYD